MTLSSNVFQMTSKGPPKGPKAHQCIPRCAERNERLVLRMRSEGLRRRPSGPYL
jgi:hypothetical protein